MSERRCDLSGLTQELKRPATPTLERLRRLGIWLPVVGVGILLGLLELLTFNFQLSRASHIAIGLLAIGLVSAGAYLFSRYIFLQVQQQEEKINRRNQELATLNAVGAAVNESLDLNEVLARALDKVLEVTGADSAEVFLWQPEAGELVQTAFRGLCPEAFQERTRFKLSEGFPGWTAETGNPIIIHDLAGDLRFLRTGVKEAGFRSFATVPLRSKGKVVGVLGVAALDSARLTQADVELLAAIGNQIGVAIENAGLHAQLATMTVLEERQRIAREIHDGVAQELGYLYLKIGELEANPSVSAIQGELRLLKEVAASAYEEVRQAIFGLKAIIPKGVGFVPSVAEYLRKFSEQTGIAVELKVAVEKATRLAPHAEAQLTRIIQEALANVRKHAQAERAWVIFDAENGRAKVTIQDDGRGFDPLEATRLDRSCYGLQTMRERGESAGGDFSIEAGPGQGTKVIVRFPLEA